MSPPRVPLGILIDNRGRFSLTHFQLVLWSIVIVSLVSGVFWGRLVEGVHNALDFTIPGQVLGLLGISAGSAVTASVVKASKDITASSRIAASGTIDPPRPAQMFLLEEGQYADQVVDVTKFQNFVITLILVAAYIALAIGTIVDAKSAAAVTSLPTLSGSFLVLLGISHAAYVAGKVPSQAGQPSGLSFEQRAIFEKEAVPPDFTPRNSRAPT